MKIYNLKFTNDAERLCALAAISCHSTVDINELYNKLSSKDISNILRKVILSRHFSVLEHANFTFSITDVSRVLLAQLTRHRIATFSVQSQRYVKLDDTSTFVIPDSIKNNKLLLSKCKSFFKQASLLYDELVKKEIPIEDARYVMPNSLGTRIILTMNARELRHFFSLRCCNKTQYELRNIACKILKIVKQKTPLLFFKAGPNCINVNGKCCEYLSCGMPWKKNT
ncbi:MAG: FAD-dependent thymidylate synthase [Endomicrobium sp.]|jgi:thymidylate synthase (FAD)|nr:FAD-dependent thymidylate synthase [Endomicrobium sp.]